VVGNSLAAMIIAKSENEFDEPMSKRYYATFKHDHGKLEETK
jgi:hypothetical protein